MPIKTKINKTTGKTKYQARIDYNNAYYAAKTFQSRPLAQAWEQATFLKAIKGETKPSVERTQQRERDAEQKALEAELKLPLGPWAERYIADQVNWKKGKQGPTRHGDFRRVAALAGDTPLRALNGRAGAKFIREFTATLYASRQTRSNKPRPRNAPPQAPLADNTVRLLLTALFALIAWARVQLPEDSDFSGPDMEALKRMGWCMPPAHGNPRKRDPSDDDFAQVLTVLGVNSALGELIQIQDETGCRLGEVRNAYGSRVTFFCDREGELVGGNLHLARHKTFHKTQTARDVPLSLPAARLLLARKKIYGNGRLFPTLRTSDKVCKDFDDACVKAGVRNLVTKDFRRSFANRNKNCVPYVDMVQILGASELLDEGSATPGEKATRDTLGHTSLRTTIGYTVTKSEQLARTFTDTSRNARVLALVKAMKATTPEGSAPSALDRRAAQPEKACIAPVTLSPEVVALARALGTYGDLFE